MSGKFSYVRGPQRKRPQDNSWVLTVKFRLKEYAKLKTLSMDTETPIRELIMHAVRHTYGETTAEEMARIVRPTAPEPEKPVKIAATSHSPWTFSADTFTTSVPVVQAAPPVASRIEPLPKVMAKPSRVDEVEVKAPDERKAAEDLRRMLGMGKK